MLVESLISSIVIGKIRGLKIRTLENVHLHKWWLVFISFLLEAISSLILRNDIEPFNIFIKNNYFYIHLLVYILLFAFIISNLSYKSFYIILLGSILNFSVIMANKGFMPVSTTMAESMGFEKTIELLETGRIAGHMIMFKASTPLWILGDIINIPPPYPFPQSISIGDLFISLGAFLFIQNQMKKT